MTINKQDVCWTSQIRFSTPFILGALRPEFSFKRVGTELDASAVVLERRFPYAQSTTAHCSLFFCSYRIWSVGRSGGDWGGLHVLLHTGMWRVSPPPSRCRTGSSRSPALLADGSDLPFFSGFLTVQHFCGGTFGPQIWITNEIFFSSEPWLRSLFLSLDSWLRFPKYYRRVHIIPQHRDLR